MTSHHLLTWQNGTGFKGLGWACIQWQAAAFLGRWVAHEWCHMWFWSCPFIAAGHRRSLQWALICLISKGSGRAGGSAGRLLWCADLHNEVKVREESAENSPWPSENNDARIMRPLEFYVLDSKLKVLCTTDWSAVELKMLEFAVCQWMFVSEMPTVRWFQWPVTRELSDSTRRAVLLVCMAILYLN